jgi:hypothetical protein
MDEERAKGQDEEPNDTGPEDGALEPANGTVLPFDPKVLEGVPPEVRRTITAGFQMMFSGGPAGSQVASRLVDKFAPEHVQMVLQSMEKESQRDYRSRRNDRLAMLAVVTLLLMFFGFLVVRLGGANDPELLEKLVLAAGGVVCGLAGGFGLGRSGILR